MGGLHSSKQAGFTLVELIVVIVILGILSATALPKFINVTEDANMAAAEAMAGAVSSAVFLVQSKAMVEGDTGAGTVSMADGTPVSTTANLFPTAAANGIVAALQSTDGFTISHSNSGGIYITEFQLEGTTTCKVTYTQNTGVVDKSAITTTNC